MGLVGKSISGSWMALVSQCKGILEMNEHLNEAVKKLVLWSTNATPLIHKDTPAQFASVGVKVDVVLLSLTSPNSIDQITIKLPQTLVKAYLRVVQK